MKYTILFLVLWLQLLILAHGQPNRKSEIEKLTTTIYSINDFRRIVDSLQMSVNELSNYPVIFPVRYPCISSGFGRRFHPIYKVQKFHAGIDFAEVKGTPIYATGNGIVIRKGYSSGYGMFIEIQHAGGFRSFYAHLSKALVNVDSVYIGKYIACVGNSGVTTGYHLHYEVRKGNYCLNPMEWCCCLLEVLNRQNLQIRH